MVRWKEKRFRARRRFAVPPSNQALEPTTPPATIFAAQGAALAKVVAHL